MQTPYMTLNMLLVVLLSSIDSSWTAATPHFTSAQGAAAPQGTPAVPESSLTTQEKEEGTVAASPRIEGQSSAGGNNTSSQVAGQFNNAKCRCEDDVGDSCTSNYENPCCSPLACQNGRCINRQFCLSPGAICPQGLNNCCFLDNQACLIDFLSGQFTCQNCVGRRGQCNAAIPPGFPGGCCPNSLCLNRGFGFFCYTTGNSFGLVP